MTGTSDERFVVLTLLDHRLDTLYTRRYPYRGSAISESAIDSAVSRATRRLPTDLATEYRRQVVVPPVYPPVIDVVAGDDGTVSLELHSATANRLYLLVSSVGDVLGSFSLPGVEKVQWVQRDAILVTRRDADDVESVVRYDLAPP